MVGSEEKVGGQSDSEIANYGRGGGDGVESASGKKTL